MFGCYSSKIVFLVLNKNQLLTADYGSKKLLNLLYMDDDTNKIPFET